VYPGRIVGKQIKKSLHMVSIYIPRTRRTVLVPATLAYKQRMLNCKTDGNLERFGKDIFDHSDHRVGQNNTTRDVGPKGRAWKQGGTSF
jgi:hypothetical protein